MESSKDIRILIKEVFEESFPNTKLMHLTLRRKIGGEGDGNIDVTIFYEDKKGRFDPKRIPAFLTMVVRKLHEIEKPFFPSISFIPKSNKRKHSL